MNDKTIKTAQVTFVPGTVTEILEKVSYVKFENTHVVIHLEDGEFVAFLATDVQSVFTSFEGN